MSVMVAGQPASDRIMRQLDNRTFNGHAKPDKIQVAMVLHALADHTAIMEMVKHDRMGKAEQGMDPTKEHPYWPTETSIGRWFHDVGYQLQDEVFMSENKEYATYCHACDAVTQHNRASGKCLVSGCGVIEEGRVDEQRPMQSAS